MTVCVETGEVLAETHWTVSCSPRIDHETGERDQRTATPFKVSSSGDAAPPHKNKTSTECKKSCCIGAQVIILAIATMMMLAPSFGVTFWVLIETAYHYFAHTNPKMYQHPLHRFFFQEYCGYCQAKVRMDKVRKLQDRRHKNYIANLTVGS